MATYRDVQRVVRELCGRSVKTCWIAHVKELNGLPVRRAPNRASAGRRVNPCPLWARPIIEQAMRHLEMLP